MAQHEHNQAAATPPSGGFAVWMKRLRRFFRLQRSAVGSHRIKKDIERLEKERLEEKTALLKQRRFYENLLRRRGHTRDHASNEQSATVASTEQSNAGPAESVNPVVSAKDRIPKAGKESETPVKASPEKKIEKPSSFFSMFRYKTEVPPAEAASSVVAPAGRSRLTDTLRAEREAEEKTQERDEVEQRFWQPYGGIKTNLVKDQGVLFFNWRQRLLMLSLALILCTLAISLVYVGLLVWQKERLDANEATFANFDAINTEISKNEKDIEEIVLFNRKLELVSFVLSNHVYWTNFLGFLEDTTLKDVYLEGLEADLTGTYSVPAVARNLDTVSLQLELYKAYPKMRTVAYSNAQSVAGAAGTEPVTRFTLQMTIDPSLFIQQP